MRLATEVERARVLDRFDRLSELMDSRYRIPKINVRFGWDPIGGLIPIAGDLATLGLSLSLVIDAHRLGAPAPMIGRMLVNVATDAIVGAVPILGSIFDVFFRANDRNLRLMLRHIEMELSEGKTAKPQKSDR